MQSRLLFDSAVAHFSEHVGPIADLLVEEAFAMVKLSRDSGELSLQHQAALKIFLRRQLPNDIDTSAVIRNIFSNLK